MKRNIYKSCPKGYNNNNQKQVIVFRTKRNIQKPQICQEILNFTILLPMFSQNSMSMGVFSRSISCARGV